MSVTFLSEDFMTEGTAALNAHDGFSSAISGVEMTIQFVVTDAADGDINYYLATTGGTAEMASGVAENADATITSNYETAVGISKGELNTQMAFMTGKIKVSGNMAILLMNQAVINEFPNAFADLDIDY